MPLREVIQKFKEAGLGSIPGGGGEILVDRVRNRISPLKCNTEQWLEVMKIAHELGLNSSATMMFGHVEAVEDRIEHLERIREVQDQTAWFYRVYLLDFSAGKRCSEGYSGRLGRVPANAGSISHLSGQLSRISKARGSLRAQR